MNNNGSFWAKLIETNNLPLKRFLSSRQQSSEDAADTIQDTYIRLVKVQPTSVANPKAYMYKTAANLAINNYNKTKKYEDRTNKVSEEEQANSVDLDIAPETPELQLEANRKKELLFEALKDLPQNCRTAFILHRFYPDTYLDIAKKLDVSVSMVEKYIAQALNHCRCTLEQRK